MPNAEEILEQVTTAVTKFGTTASQLAVGGGDSLEKIRADIHRRLRLINPKVSFDQEP